VEKNLTLSHTNVLRMKKQTIIDCIIKCITESNNYAKIDSISLNTKTLGDNCAIEILKYALLRVLDNNLSQFINFETLGPL